MMRFWSRALAAAAAAAFFSAGVAAAQENEYEAQVRAYLDSGMQAHRGLGYERQRNIPDLLTPLLLNQPYLWAVNLREGVNYRIYGACDDDCSDLDMEIYGHDGVLVDRDIALDDAPFVQITPTESGAHYVRIWVFTCAAEPCYSGARVVSGGSPVDRTLPEPIAAPGLGEPDDYIGVVRAELEAASAQHIAAGYAQHGEDVIAAIPLGEGHRETYNLEAGRSYLFQGACDQDCSDVDLEILDPAGASLAEDIALDDRPVVGVTPAAAGAYTARIWLAQCSVEPCFVGLRSFVQ